MLVLFTCSYRLSSEFLGGSLADVLFQNHRRGQHLSEAELKQLLYQVAQGLRYIHSQGLVHLDIKPGKA